MACTCTERDLPTRLVKYDGTVELERVALVFEDVYGTDLPSFDVETKKKDPRYKWYLSIYGDQCWELDAMDPVVLRKRVEASIKEMIDLEYWQRCEVAERAERESLRHYMKGWRQATNHGP